MKRKKNVIKRLFLNRYSNVVTENATVKIALVVMAIIAAMQHYNLSKATDEAFVVLVPTGFTGEMQVSRKAAELRVSYGIKLPDALQIAVALIAGCDVFLTNDDRLKRVTDLQILVIEELSNNE